VIFALFTSISWSISGFASSRISRAFGAGPANLLRLSLASIILLLLCLAGSYPLWTTGAIWYIVAGLLHLTLGDIALFAAFRRLGPRLGVLMVGSLAPPTALLAEGCILGTTLTGSQLLCGAAVLVLVATAVAPRERQHLSAHELCLGLLFGAVAAVGQGLGTTLQRVGNVQMTDPISQPWTVTFLRVSAGALGVGIWMLFLHLNRKKPFKKPTELFPHQKIKGNPAFWLILSTLLGPLLGMYCLSAALESTPAALVQAVITTMPVFMIPVAWILDGNAPSLRSIFSGSAAVGLTALLMFL